MQLSQTQKPPFFFFIHTVVPPDSSFLVKLVELPFKTKEAEGRNCFIIKTNKQYVPEHM